MNLPSLHLRSLSGPKLDEKALRLSVQRLSKVTAHLDESGTLPDDDLVAELRMRVRDGYARGESFDVYTSVSRRESRILSLYLMDLASQADRIQLPPFDKAVAISVLGHRSQKLKKHIRRQATQLFFTHFDEELLPCLEWIASRLQASWRIEEMHQVFDFVSRAFREHAGLLFNVEAPTAVAERWDQRESVDQLADRFGIPQGGKFRERLMGEVILRRLTLASHGAIPADLDDLVTKSKERPLSGGPLGSEAVKILINRSTRECNGQVPAGWREQLVTYSCDPRVPNAAEQAKWWGWATPGEKDIAIRALSELTLQEFIKLLERSLRGTEKAHQFPERKRVLLKLFELGKVTEARLVVHQGLYNAMGSRTREGQQHLLFSLLFVLSLLLFLFFSLE